MAEHLTPNTPYDQTIQHLALLAAKVAKLNDLRVESELQVIHRLATDYRTGAIGPAEAFQAFQALRQHAAPKFRDRWDAGMPHELHAARIKWTGHRYLPDPDGVWRGEYPFTNSSRTPWPGASVVYVLFNDRNEPIYTGSTEQFRVRLRAHRGDGKRFTYWVACQCKDREAAYELEDRLLKERKPSMNARAGR